MSLDGATSWEWSSQRLRGLWRHLEDGVLGRRSRQILLLSALTGLIVGVVIAGFEFVVNDQLLNRIEALPLWVQAAAPTVGLALAALSLRTAGHGATPEMSDDYIRNFHDRHHRLNRRPVVGRALASAATLGFGGAMGYEGPSVYIGAAIGARLQAALARFFTRDDAKTLMVAGAAAGMAAIFKAPATGAVFAIEVPYQDDLAGRFILPALCASAVSYATYAALRTTAPLIPVGGAPRFDLVDLGGAIVIGLVCGLAALGFTRALALTKDLAARHRGTRGTLLRVAAGGAVLATLAVVSYRLTGQTLTLGPGYRAVTWASGARPVMDAVVLLLVLRAVAVLVTVGGGGAGGMFIPLVVEGALLGRVLEGPLHAPPGPLFPVLGIAAFVAAGYRCPLAAVMFVAETTGKPAFVVPALLAAVVAHLVMAGNSVAPDQVAVRAGHLEARFRLPVTAALAPDAPTVEPQVTVADFLEDWVLGRHAVTVPVVDGDQRVLGVVDVADAEAVARTDRDGVTVADVMDPEHPVGRNFWTLRQALSAMEAGDVDVLPVVDRRGIYQGLLSTAAILALKDLLDQADDYGPGPGAGPVG